MQCKFEAWLSAPVPRPLFCVVDLWQGTFMFSCEGAVVVVNGTLELSGASVFSRASVLASDVSTVRLMGRCV
jgi:hypothetical protein